MSDLNAVLFHVGNALKTRNVSKNVVMRAANGDAHAVLLVALRQAIRGTGVSAYMWNVAGAVAWGPIKAAWMPTTVAGKAAKETIDHLIKEALKNGGSTACGQINGPPGIVSHMRIRSNVEATWLAIHDSANDTLHVLAVGAVDKMAGRKVKVALLITCALQSNGVPESLRVKRLPYKGDLVEDKLAELEEEEDGWCFLTTACLRALETGCEPRDLDVLRAFRDGYVAARPDGAAAIAAYYSIAPPIVAAINARPDADAVYRDIYGSLVRPAVTLIEAGAESRAFTLYRDYTLSLQRRVFGADQRPAG
jgi:hypothetical protein